MIQFNVIKLMEIIKYKSSYQQIFISPIIKQEFFDYLKKYTSIKHNIYKPLNIFVNIFQINDWLDSKSSKIINIPKIPLIVNHKFKQYTNYDFPFEYPTNIYHCDTTNENVAKLMKIYFESTKCIDATNWNAPIFPNPFGSYTPICIINYPSYDMIILQDKPIRFSCDLLPSNCEICLKNGTSISPITNVFSNCSYCPYSICIVMKSGEIIKLFDDGTDFTKYYESQKIISENKLSKNIISKHRRVVDFYKGLNEIISNDEFYDIQIIDKNNNWLAMTSTTERKRYNTIGQSFTKWIDDNSNSLFGIEMIKQFDSDNHSQMCIIQDEDCYVVNKMYINDDIKSLKTFLTYENQILNINNKTNLVGMYYVDKNNMTVITRNEHEYEFVFHSRFFENDYIMNPQLIKKSIDDRIMIDVKQQNNDIKMTFRDPCNNNIFVFDETYENTSLKNIEFTLYNDNITIEYENQDGIIYTKNSWFKRGVNKIVNFFCGQHESHSYNHNCNHNCNHNHKHNHKYNNRNNNELEVFNHVKLNNQSYYGWKIAKLCNVDKYCIVKLIIPADAKFVRSFEDKYRCNYAIVARILEFVFNDEIDIPNNPKAETCMHSTIVKYQIGKYIYPDGWDDKSSGCSHGIHFFFNKNDLYKYVWGRYHKKGYVTRK